MRKKLLSRVPTTRRARQPGAPRPGCNRMLVFRPINVSRLEPLDKVAGLSGRAEFSLAACMEEAMC